jgi:IS4 transposase
MLAEIAPLLPPDFQVYSLFDSWYASAKLIKYCRRQTWHVIAGLKSNRCLNGKQLSQWHQDLRHQRYERATVPAADGSQTTYFVRSLRGRLNQVPFEVCVLISKRHPRSKSPAYFLCTDLALSAQETLDWYRDRWPVEVDNFYLKTRLGLADYQMQCFEAIEKFHALVFLALAYLQYRLVQRLAAAHQTSLARSNDQRRTLADVIRLHRAEHEVQLLKAACQLALQHNSLAPVLAKFLRPFSAITSHLESASHY